MFWSPNSAPQQVFELLYRKRTGDERPNVPFFLLSHRHTHALQQKREIFSTFPHNSRSQTPAVRSPAAFASPAPPARGEPTRCPALRSAGTGSRTLPAARGTENHPGRERRGGRGPSSRRQPPGEARGRGLPGPPALPAVPRRTEPPARPLRERSRGAGGGGAPARAAGRSPPQPPHTHTWQCETTRLWLPSPWYCHSFSSIFSTSMPGPGRRRAPWGR